MIRFNQLNPFVYCSAFNSPCGVKESYVLIKPDPCIGIKPTMETLAKLYSNALETTGLSHDTQVFSRLFVSDYENQKDLIRNCPLIKTLEKDAFSIVEQRPVNGAHAALFSYHIRSDQAIRKQPLFHDNLEGRNGVLVSGSHYQMLWTANYTGNGPFNAEIQSAEVLKSLSDVIEENNMTFLKNGIRTWVYVRDIDNHYKGMVKARREFFQKCGLTQKTRYLASTGIEGKFREINSLVSLDSLFVNNVAPDQIERMEALQNLSHTIKYGVTFERGIKVLFGDRAHLYISGTASINDKGELLHPGDVEKQTVRTLDNMEALLNPHTAGFRDMAYLLVYLRDLSDRDIVASALKNRLPADIPIMTLQAPVCRPGWLVEIEGVALKVENNNFPAFL